MSQFVVMTTINAPTETAHALAAKQAWELLVVGDNKTPGDWDVPGVVYIPIETQRGSTWSLAHGLPENHYCRKNLGYLEAMARGATVIAETDDDNLPGSWPPDEPSRLVRAPILEGADGWVNIYPYFTDERIWPRGYPLELISKSLRTVATQVGERDSAVHQYLAAGDPDVDAVYRMTVSKDDHAFRTGRLILGPGAMTTFNSQCTVWFPEAFELMYLPSRVSFRMTDIWRSLVAQVCLWASGQQLSYHSDGVTQIRNEHDLVRDFSDEVVGYLHNRAIADRLMALDLVGDHAADLRRCYAELRSMGHVSSGELGLLDSWLDDCARARA